MLVRSVCREECGPDRSHSGGTGKCDTSRRNRDRSSGHPLSRCQRHAAKDPFLPVEGHTFRYPTANVETSGPNDRWRNYLISAQRVVLPLFVFWLKSDTDEVLGCQVNPSRRPAKPLLVAVGCDQTGGSRVRSSSRESQYSWSATSLGRFSVTAVRSSLVRPESALADGCDILSHGQVVVGHVSTSAQFEAWSRRSSEPTQPLSTIGNERSRCPVA